MESQNPSKEARALVVVQRLQVILRHPTAEAKLKALRTDWELWHALENLGDMADPNFRDTLTAVQLAVAELKSPRWEKCKICSGSGEWVTPESRYGAPSRCRTCGGSGSVSVSV